MLIYASLLCYLILFDAHHHFSCCLTSIITKSPSAFLLTLTPYYAFLALLDNLSDQYCFRVNRAASHAKQVTHPCFSMSYILLLSGTSHHPSRLSIVGSSFLLNFNLLHQNCQPIPPTASLFVAFLHVPPPTCTPSPHITPNLFCSLHRIGDVSFFICVISVVIFHR